MGIYDKREKPKKTYKAVFIFHPARNCERRVFDVMEETAETIARSFLCFRADWKASRSFVLKCYFSVDCENFSRIFSRTKDVPENGKMRG